MNPQETEQVIARDELWVPTAERVNISTTNAFTIFADVPEILMQQFWYTITKIKGSESYEFLLANKRCVIDAEVFMKDNISVYEKKVKQYTVKYKMIETLSRPASTRVLLTDTSNDKLRKSRIDILWGMFYKENLIIPSLIWETLLPNDHRTGEQMSRREKMSYPRFTKNGEMFAIWSRHPATMLNNEIIQSESYKRFILYSTGQIPPKKSRGKGSQGKKSADPTEESVDVSDESEPEPLIRRKTSSRRVTKKKKPPYIDDNIIPETRHSFRIGKVQSA
ncbi:hypothetical protein Tco_1554965 [Tanacetum coccineum]